LKNTQKSEVVNVSTKRYTRPKMKISTRPELWVSWTLAATDHQLISVT